MAFLSYLSRAKIMAPRRPREHGRGKRKKIEFAEIRGVIGFRDIYLRLSYLTSEVKLYKEIKSEPIKLEISLKEPKISSRGFEVSLYKTVDVEKISYRIPPKPRIRFSIEVKEIGNEGLYRDLSPIGLVGVKGYLELFDCAAIMNLCYQGKCEDAAGMLISKDLSGVGVAISDGVTSSLGIVSHGIMKALQAYVYKYGKLPSTEELLEIGKIGARAIRERPELSRTPLFSQDILKEKIAKGLEYGSATLSAAYLDLEQSRVEFVVIGDATFGLFNTNFGSETGCKRIPASNAVVVNQLVPQSSAISSRLGDDPNICPAMYYRGSLEVLDEGVIVVASDGAMLKDGKHILESSRENPLLANLNLKPNDLVKLLAPNIGKNLRDDASIGLLKIMPPKECLEKIKRSIEENDAFRFLLELI